MSCSNRSVTIASLVTLEEYPQNKRQCYLLKNPSELFSRVDVRSSDVPKQGGHGVDTSLAFYGPRDLPFYVQIIAPDRSTLVSMEQTLRRALYLRAAQSYLDEDGYKLIAFTDEDTIAKQTYARIIDPPEFEMVEDTLQRTRLVSFEMRADDPTLYAQTATNDDGPESFQTTTYTLQDGALQTIKDGDLPTIQDSIFTSVSVSNSGTYDSPPEIIISGPSTNPVVTNQTTGKKMEFSKSGGVSLNAGETLTINVASGSIVKTVSGVDTDVSGNMSDDSQWIYIQRGTNAFTVEDDTTDDLSAQLSVTFRAAWL